MANTITHGSTDIVNASALVTDAALPNTYANSAGSIVANNTQLFTRKHVVLPCCMSTYGAI